MELNLESNLLLWIGDEVLRKEDEGRAAAVAIHLLLVHLASSVRDDSELTQSTEISLQTFERAELYRALRTMISKQLICFVDEQGNEVLQQTEQHGLGGKFMDHSGPAFVSLTENGRSSYFRLTEDE